MNENEQILTSLLSCRRVDLYVDQKELTPGQKKQYNQMLNRRALGEPLQYIIGHCEFLNTKLDVNQNVLVPRPETELLVEMALEKLSDIKNRSLRVLDLGTGSGNIAIALAKNSRECHVTAVDISNEAIMLAQNNAKQNFVENRTNFICADMFKFLEMNENVSPKFDMIISNPPYIQSDQIGDLPLDVQHEPRLALDGGEDGLDFYRGIIHQAGKCLNEDGFLIFEIGEGQADEVKKIFQSLPYFHNTAVYRDYADKERFIFSQYKLMENIINF